uniref:Uncharacterized protein n=1 Tax=Anguilla anguilla TaxID=7936 RepID=A0A0E9SUB5_ANGAN
MERETQFSQIKKTLFSICPPWSPSVMDDCVGSKFGV